MLPLRTRLGGLAESAAICHTGKCAGGFLRLVEQSVLDRIALPSPPKELPASQPGFRSWFSYSSTEVASATWLSPSVAATSRIFAHTSDSVGDITAQSSRLKTPPCWIMPRPRFMSALKNMSPVLSREGVPGFANMGGVRVHHHHLHRVSPFFQKPTSLCSPLCASFRCPRACNLLHSLMLPPTLVQKGSEERGGQEVVTSCSPQTPNLFEVWARRRGEREGVGTSSPILKKLIKK